MCNCIICKIDLTKHPETKVVPLYLNGKRGYACVNHKGVKEEHDRQIGKVSE